MLLCDAIERIRTRLRAIWRHLGVLWGSLSRRLGLFWDRLGAILESSGVYRDALHCYVTRFGRYPRPRHRTRSHLGAIWKPFLIVLPRLDTLGPSKSDVLSDLWSRLWTGGCNSKAQPFKFHVTFSIHFVPFFSGPLGSQNRLYSF